MTPNRPERTHTVTTQPEQPTAQQGSHFWLITVSGVQDSHGAVTYSTRYGTITPGHGQTRQDVYDQIRQIIAAEIGDRYTVLFFSLEPNQL